MDPGSYTLIVRVYAAKIIRILAGCDAKYSKNAMFSGGDLCSADEGQLRSPCVGGGDLPTLRTATPPLHGPNPKRRLRRR